MISKIPAKTLVMVFGVAWLMVGCGQKSASPAWSLDQSAASGPLKRFVATQEAQARALAKSDGVTLPPEFASFFQAAGQGDWHAATNRFGQMSKRVQADRLLGGAWWWAAMDFEGVLEVFPPADQYAVAFGRDIIQSVPDGGIYFGGTDPGRFAVTALVESHADGTPFFVLSQNALADAAYLKYLRSMYDGKIYTPTDADLHESLQAYTANVQRRLAHDQQFPKEPKQIRPGEDVRLDAKGQIELRSQMNVIGVRELLTKTVFDKNPDRQFYVEESFPLDWMYPHLEPHGLIMKINRQPLVFLPEAAVSQDREYWIKQVAPLIGDWLNPGTSVEEVAAFAEKVYLRQDLSGFKGDPRFVQNAAAAKMDSKLRSSLGDLYAWRGQHAADAAEKERMNQAADFAFRQAFALCPYSSEVVFRYINLLLSENRIDEAVLIAETALHAAQIRNLEVVEQYHSLVEQLKSFKRQRK